MATLEVLGAFSKQWNCSLFEAAFKGGIEAKLADRQLIPLREFCNFINNLESRASRPGPSGSGENAAAVLDDMMKEINYESYLYDMFDDRAAQSKWQNVLEFTNWLKERGCGGKDKSGDEKNLLELTQMVALMTMLEGKDEEPDAVRMSTLHASKGLEFPHVFLVGVEEGILPHKGDPDASVETIGARMQEERRLMYVGITRAQRTLQITWCKQTQARGRAGALRRLALYQGNGAGRGRRRAHGNRNYFAEGQAGEFEGIVGDAEGAAAAVRLGQIMRDCA